MRQPILPSLISTALATLTLICVASASAETIAYSDPFGQGNQAWPGNLGLVFQVNEAITVNELGVFNSNGTSTLATPGSIAVGIFDSAGSLLTSITFSSGTTYAVSASDILQSITPIVLAPGKYEVAAVGFNSSNEDGNVHLGGSTGPSLDDAGGALTFLKASYDSSTTLDPNFLCEGCDPGAVQAHEFDAGTFGYTVNPTPEPSSLVLLGTGLLGLGSMARRRFIK